jgi:hypothetical protein
MPKKMMLFIFTVMAGCGGGENAGADVDVQDTEDTEARGDVDAMEEPPIEMTEAEEADLPADPAEDTGADLPADGVEEAETVLPCPAGDYAAATIDECEGNPDGGQFEDACASCSDCVPYGPPGSERGRCGHLGAADWCLKPCTQNADCEGGRLPTALCEQAGGGCYCIP